MLRNIPLVIYFLVLIACGSSVKSNSPPAISGSSPTTLNEQEEYFFQPTVHDPDGDTLVFSIQNRPNWLTFNSTTGELSGLAESENIGIHRNIIVAVSDGKGGLDSLPAFNITVVDINFAPNINIENNNLELDAGENFLFNFSVNDYDGDATSFNFGVIPEFIEIEESNNEYRIIVADVESVKTGTFFIFANDESGLSSSVEITVSAYPRTQTGNGRTILGSQNGSGVHLVILGDGFTEEEMDDFRATVAQFLIQFAADPGIKSHLEAWNIHMVETASLESGVDDVYGSDTVMSAFNSGYSCGGITRLICADTFLAYDAALSEYPQTDYVVLAVNDNQYGGSGGEIPIFSKGAYEIALHELGHSFALLADEYVDAAIAATYLPYYVEGDYANVSQLNDPLEVPWHYWIDDKINYPSLPGEVGIGIFEGAYYHAFNFFRPISASRMETNDAYFGPINSEQWNIRIYEVAGPVHNLLPLESNITLTDAETIAFSLEPLFNEAIQEITWNLNGEELVEMKNRKIFEFSSGKGQHTVEVRLRDVSGAIKRPGEHMANYSHVWNVTIL